ncbi:MAG TPA: hypothetical protein VJT74_07165 [Pyrinomonadaceae bacterium]|nr:hypothetical protein [Pyrinomonadaceae bacterium]
MKTQLLKVMFALLLLSSVCPVPAQQKISSKRQYKSTLVAGREAASAEVSEPAARLAEERGAQVKLLLVRKSALKNYLLSVSPQSPDYKATENAIREIDLKLNNLGEATRKDVAAAPRPPAVAPAAPLPQAFKAGKSLNDFLVEKIKSKVDQSSNTKQTESPSASSNSTSLVDQSSASDLIGVALNLSGLTFQSDDEDKMEADSTSVTASAYSLYAALQGANPLNPIFYNQNRGWRRVFFTLGYDNEKAEGTETTDTAKIGGVKILLWDKRDPNDAAYRAGFAELGGLLEQSNSQFSQYYRRIIIFIFTENEKTKELIAQEFTQFIQTERTNTNAALAAATTQEERDRLQRRLNDIDTAETRFQNGDAFKFGPDNRLAKGTTGTEVRFFGQFQNDYLATNSKKSFSQDILDEINEFVDDELEAGLESFARLDTAARALIEKIRTAPQFSIQALTKQRENGADDYTGQLIFDYGLADRVNLTLNGGFNYVNSKVVGGDTRGGTFAGQLQFRFNKQPESITGKKPVYFYLATNDTWATGAKPLFTGQAKLTIPIADGFDLPLSLVVMSRTNASNKNVLKGQFAFTMDTARLLRAFLSK